MDLWIRSQDKKNFLKVDCVYIDDFPGLGFTRINCSEMFLGDYKSKKRAIEIIDEIQNKLETLEDVKTYVYEMPKE